jgi:hypothetical protein
MAVSPTGEGYGDRSLRPGIPAGELPEFDPGWRDELFQCLACT